MGGLRRMRFLSLILMQAKELDAQRQRFCCGPSYFNTFFPSSTSHLYRLTEYFINPQITFKKSGQLHLDRIKTPKGCRYVFLEWFYVYILPRTYLLRIEFFARRDLLHYSLLQSFDFLCHLKSPRNFKNNYLIIM